MYFVEREKKLVHYYELFINKKKSYPNIHSVDAYKQTV